MADKYMLVHAEVTDERLAAAAEAQKEEHERWSCRSIAQTITESGRYEAYRLKDGQESGEASAEGSFATAQEMQAFLNKARHREGLKAFIFAAMEVVPHRVEAVQTTFGIQAKDGTVGLCFDSWDLAQEHINDAAADAPDYWAEFGPLKAVPLVDIQELNNARLICMQLQARANSAEELVAVQTAQIELLKAELRDSVEYGERQKRAIGHLSKQLAAFELAMEGITCKGPNCEALNGVGHSVECLAAHEAAGVVEDPLGGAHDGCGTRVVLDPPPVRVEPD